MLSFPEVEVICEADGEGEGIWTLWQCLSFKVEGKAHSWAKSTRGGITRYDPGHFYKDAATSAEGQRTRVGKAGGAIGTGNPGAVQTAARLPLEGAACFLPPSAAKPRPAPVRPSPTLTPLYPPSLESLLRRVSPRVPGLQRYLRPRLLGWRHLLGVDILLVFLLQREQGRARLASRRSRAAWHRGSGGDRSAAERALRPPLPGSARDPGGRRAEQALRAGGARSPVAASEQRAGRRLFVQFKQRATIEMDQ